MKFFGLMIKLHYLLIIHDNSLKEMMAKLDKWWLFMIEIIYLKDFIQEMIRQCEWMSIKH